MLVGEIVKSLYIAIDRRCYTQQVVHHPDKGLQYCESEYQVVLKASEIMPSMTDG